MDEDTFPVISVVKQAISDLSKINDGEKMVEMLLNVKRFLGTCENSAPAQEREEFSRNHYTIFLRFLVAQIGPNWVDFLTAERIELWDSFFLEGPADQAFLVLMDSLDKTGPSICLDRCVHVLERFLQKGALAEVIWQVSKQQLENNPASVLHESILGRISSFPDRLANCLQKNNKPLFYPRSYYPCLANSILDVLQRVSDSLRDGKDCSISFASQVVGKVCMQGWQKELLPVIVSRLMSLIQSDCIWQRICWRLVESVPDRWMEPVVTGLVQMALGPVVLSKLLGDLVVKNKKIQFLLMKKMVFLQCGLKKEALQSILGYLSLETSRRSLLVKVLRELLEVWSSDGVVKHSHQPQLLHINCCILICLGLLNKQEMESCKQDLLFALTSGTRLYLDSSITSVRRMGMVVAESLSRHIDLEGPGLSFQYEDDEDTVSLKALLTPTCLSQPDAAENVKKPVERSTSNSLSPSSKNPPIKLEGGTKPDSTSDSELDSDDDLIPYDMSADTELKKSKAPAYIRDCIEVLLSDDIDKVETTMSSLATLIRENTSATKEVSVELAKILLHIDDKPSVERLRHAALVALAVTDPVPVSQYVTNEFYSLNYSLRQRMDILDVLASAAQELSEEPPLAKTTWTGSSSAGSQSTGTWKAEGLTDWRKVIEERIATKTRRFTKGLSTPTQVSTPNRYHAVAGYFFFPLIQNFDRPMVTFNLLGEDRLVLGRMVHTLGILMHLALNATIASQMGKALLEFVWVLRFNTDGSAECPLEAPHD
ncbi:hypothetical protein GDO86_017437 [Hymenochirus boettgeri]|uniref:Telomere length regulation protein TEL2 homolog n=1 Tax=Hymenochirus boettgeri TaxID=247094 RepID=A0A8T2ISJ5_9PIPI|nr:hypothetical protein GDO86_017437 [Hymenochirus boettgeri]